MVLLKTNRTNVLLVSYLWFGRSFLLPNICQAQGHFSILVSGCQHKKLIFVRFVKVAQMLGGFYVFYDEYCYWCAQIRMTPNKVAKICGIPDSSPPQWRKRGSTPNGQTLEKLAAFFGITIDELLDHTKSMPADMVEQMQDELFEKRKLLFDLSKNATEQDLDKFIKMLKIMMGDDE